MSTEVYHVKVADQIWEVNIPAKKVLLRSELALSEGEKGAIKSIPMFGIEDYITKEIDYPYFKYVRDTKIIFSKFPICSYIKRNFRNDNPDAYTVCDKIASPTRHAYTGYRCDEHRSS